MADYSLIEGALQRGYSMDEIADKLAQAEGFDPSAIRARGYTTGEMMKNLGYVKPETSDVARGFVTSDVARGFVTSFKQLPQLGYGLLAGAGAVAESVAGEGGVSTSMKNFGVKKYQEAGADIEKDSKQSDSLSYSWEQAKQGDFGSLVDWLQYGIGYGGGQAVQALATAGVGSLVGKTVLKGTAENLASKMVAKEVLRLGATEEAKRLTAQEISKIAVANVASNIGQTVAIGSQAFGMEGGEIFGDLAQKTVKEGRAATGGELAKAFGATAAAGALEFVGDKLGVDVMLGKSKMFKPASSMTGVGGRAARAAVAVPGTVLAEGGTEYLQTGIEEYGKGNEKNFLPFMQSESAQKQALDAAGLGAVGGGGMAMVGGAFSSPQKKDAAPSPSPSISSAQTADDAIAAFQDEVASVTPRGSFGNMDELAGFIEAERSDIGKRRGLLAQQQQDARDMENEFNGLVKDEQIDQSYRLNDAQKQREVDRLRERDFALAEQQREEQQGRAVEQLAAVSEAQGFGAQEPTAMQLAMQQAQQKALDNEFSGLLKQERANLNEMRANVKRVAGVPVEQISTPQLEEIAQSEAHPNTKMAAVAALNDRHDAIQQERERLMQMRETRLEKQSNQPEQGAQHGAESHGTDGQVATPSVAGGGANVSGGGFDAAMVAADRGMRETASAGAAVSSGEQVGAVPVADQPTNVRALTENGKPSASWVIRNKETGEVVMETFDRKKVDALNTAKYEAVPIREYLEGLNKRNESTAAEPPAVEVRTPVQRKRPASNNIAQAIINMGGVSTSLKNDILGDASIKTRPGLFTTNGTGDLGEIAAMLSSGFGFSQIDLNDPTDNSGAKQLADLIARSVNGETIHNEEGMIRAQEQEQYEQARAEINQQAADLNIKPIRGKRTIDIVQSEINAILAEREEMTRRSREVQQLFDEVAEQKLIDEFNLKVQEYHDENAIARANRAEESARFSAEESAQGDGDSVDQASPVAGRASPTEGGRGEAEVTPEFGLVGQTEEEAIAEEQARRDVGHHNLHSIHAVLLRAVESIIPDMQRFERVFGKSQWAGYAKKLINSNDVLKGFLSQTVVGDAAKFKIALAKAADSKALESIADRLRRAMPQPEAKEIGDFGEKIGAAREGQGAEVAPEFGLVGQTEAEARAEQGRLNQPEGLTKEQIDREATAPFSLHSDVMPPNEGPTGITESMFTPDGRATKAAGDKPAEAVERPAREFIGTGDKLYSESGRALSPAPKIETGSASKTNASIKRMNAWLLDEARKEAEANGNDWQQTLLRGIDANKMQQPDLDTVNDILFGDPDGPQAKHRAPHDGSVETPKAAQSILKPLSEPTPLHPDRTSTIAAVRRGDLTAEDVAESHPVATRVADQETGSGVAMFSRGRGKLRSRSRGEITHETQRLEKEINRDLARQGQATIGAAGFITRSAVPDNARRLVAAVEKLFGVRVEFVQVEDERADIFNGVFLGGNTLFVNVDSSSPISTVIGHEFLHFLKESNPDLYAKAESDLLALANAKKFAAAAKKHQPAMNAGEEVIADTFGDQFSNPEFWEEMANRVEPSLFMRIRAAFTRFMGKLLGEIKAMGTTHKTDALYSDLDAVRDAVLSATVGAAKGRKLATPSWRNLHARFMTAWHGSPHDHDGFDSSKIGTGEGAQAYGWGHYFASLREVAEWYRDNLTDGAAERKLASIANNQTPAKKGSSADVLVRLINQNNYLNNDDIKSAGLEPEAFGFQEIDDEVKVSSLARYQYGARDYATQTIDGVEQSIYLFGDGSALLDNGEELKAVSDNHKGRLYQVELAPTEDEYLDWDKTYSEQSDFVKKALGRPNEWLKLVQDHGNRPLNGLGIYKSLEDKFISDKQASEHLRSLGIRGIRYLDGSSRSAGNGTSNYVIFDDADVKITAKESRRAAGQQAATGSTINTIAAAIRKTYGDVLDKLQAKNLITLTQTQDEAIEAAAKARADKTGQPLAEVRASLMGSVSNSVATDTPAFKRWFSGSKVVDTEGKPLRVYHGSPTSTFTEFDVGNVGAFFSDRFDVAASYAGRYNEVEFDDEGAYTDDGTDQGVYEAHLAIRNPLVMDWGGMDWGQGPEGLKLDDWASRAKRAGHDGLIVENVVDSGWLAPGLVDDAGTGRVFVAFRPEQIKSATGNNGNFDPNDLDIRRSANGAIQGFYDPQSGQSFLIADGLTNDAAPGVLAHEVGIHMAADKAASKNMERLFKRAGVLVRGHAGAFFDRVRSRMKDAGETSNEEAAAYIAEEWENNRKGAPESVASYVREWIAAVKAWLAGKGVSVDLLKLGPADIAAIARANVRQMAQGAEARAGNGTVRRSSASPTESEVRGLMAQYASTEGAPSEAQIRAAVRDYRDTERAYGGQAAYEKAKAAGKTKLGYRQWVQVRTQAFKQWFGDWEAVRGRDALQKMEAMNLDSTPALADQKAVEDVFRGEAGNPETVSKVVDPNTGEPMVVYHATDNDFSVFDSGRAGENTDANASSAEWAETARMGAWFSTKDLTGATAQSVSMPVFLNIQNPKLHDSVSWLAERAIPLAGDAASYRGELEDDGRDGLKVEDEEFGGTSFVAFSPTQIKSATGNVGTFGESDDIRFSRAGNGHYSDEAGQRGVESRRATDDIALEYGIMSPESAASTGQPQGPIWSAPEMSRTDNIIYTMQDKNIDLKRVQQAIKSSVGEIRDDIDAYLQEELFHGRAARITEEFLDKEVNPLISLMRASNVSMEDVEEYLHARHAKEANAVLAERNPSQAMINAGRAKAAQEVTALVAKLGAATDKTQRSILQKALTNATKELNRWNIVAPYKGTEESRLMLSGMSDKDADSYFAKLDPAQRAKLEAVTKKVDAIIAGTRQLYVDYGLEDQAVVDGWASLYKNYIPLMREDKDGGMGIGQGFSVKGKEVKGRTGSTRKVVDILANIASQREKLIVRGEKNRVAQALVGLAQANPNPDFWEVRSQAPTERVIDEATNTVVERPIANFKGRDNVVVAKTKDSKGNVTEQMVVFNEHNERAVRMAQALKNLDADDISHLLGEVSRWTRYFASINTQYNPIFGVTNLVRDVQTGLLNLKSTPLDGKQKELIGNLTHALPAVFKALRADRKGQAATGTWAQLWEEFQEVGGQTGYRDMFRNSHERAEALQNALDPTWWQKTWWGKAATVGGVLAVPEQFLLDAKYGGKWVFNLLSDYNTMMENGIRLSAYKVALDSKMTKERAASLAKNLTVNFNRKGQAARQVGAMYAFFNASVQGTARMAETLNHGAKPGELLGKAGKQIVYGGLLLGAVQAMLLMAAGFDDEEPPEFVRDRNIIIPIGNGKYFSIPLPLGFHVLPAISRISIEFTAGGFKKPGEHLVHIMDVLLDSFNPIGNAGLSMQTVAPTVLDPIAALTENKDWSGRQIARQDFSKLNPTPGYTRAKDTASSLSRGLAYAFNYLSGGGEYGIGIVSPTPDQIDYLLGQLTGGVGRELGKVLTTGEAMATGEDLPPHKIPLVGRFYGDTTGQSSEASKFYGTLEKLSEHRGTLDRMKDARDAEAYREYAKEHPESRLYARAARVQRELSSLRKLKRTMIERNADRAKVRQIEDRMRTLMTRFNQSVSEQKGDH